MPVSQWLASWPSLYGPALIVALGVAVFGFRSQQTAATARAASPVDNLLIASPKLMPTTAPEYVKSRMRVPWVIGPVVGAFILFPGAVVAWLGLLVSSYIYLSAQLPFAESSPASLVVWGATVGVISFKIARAQQAAAKTAASETTGSSQASSRWVNS